MTRLFPLARIALFVLVALYAVYGLRRTVMTAQSSASVRLPASAEASAGKKPDTTYAVPRTPSPNYGMHENACHEGNYGLLNALSAARASEK